ncbi:MAG: hypothetical protein P1U70_19560 [Saprospiraceae bacterium]|jgi:hypothetical protein|nr:hypothetical protein [Saprospiraceae bacterium]
MKKIIFEILLIIVLGFVAQLFLPWWIIIVVAGLVGFFFKFENSLSSYLAGFLAVSLLWGGFAGFLDASNLGLLSSKMGELFGGMGGSQMIYLTGLLGGILGGFAAMTGTLGRKMFEKTGATTG